MAKCLGTIQKRSETLGNLLTVVGLRDEDADAGGIGE